MSREVWVKLHVDLLDDPKLTVRSASDFKLWVCLILLAKQTTEDGVIHKMGPSALRDRFSLQCSPGKVVDALEYFKKNGMIELANGSIKIVNYDKRQTVKDFHEKNAERQKRWRHRSVMGDVTADVTGDVTRVEEIRSDQIPLKPPQGGTSRSHPFRSRKAKPAEPSCTGCREAGHYFQHCPRKAEYEA